MDALCQPQGYRLYFSRELNHVNFCRCVNYDTFWCTWGDKHTLWLYVNALTRKNLLGLYVNIRQSVSAL